MAAAIRASSPSDFTLVLPAGDASSGGIDGTADDGAGKGRISAGLSLGGQQVHPCTDPEFKAGATCVERVLPDGAVLSARGLVVAENGVTTYVVVITYPNGYGVNVEAGNFTMDPIPATIRKQDIPKLIHVQRPDADVLPRPARGRRHRRERRHPLTSPAASAQCPGGRTGRCQDGVHERADLDQRLTTT